MGGFVHHRKIAQAREFIALQAFVDENGLTVRGTGLDDSVFPPDLQCNTVFFCFVDIEPLHLVIEGQIAEGELNAAHLFGEVNGIDTIYRSFTEGKILF